jgi:antitoxin component YwqK of YwqJK toxin-antitoxin module
MSETGAYIDGEREGPWSYFDPDGEKIREESFAKGRQNGRWVSYYANGSEQGEGSYIDQKKDGIWQYWDATGKLVYKGEFKNGVKIREKKYGDEKK